MGKWIEPEWEIIQCQMGNYSNIMYRMFFNAIVEAEKATCFYALAYSKFFFFTQLRNRVL